MPESKSGALPLGDSPIFGRTQASPYSGCLSRPCATKPCIPSGSGAAPSRPRSSVNAANTQAPEPVILASPYSAQPLQVFAHHRVGAYYNRFQVVVSTTLWEGRDFQRWRVPCQSRTDKNLCRRHLNRGHQNHITGCRQGHRLQLFAYTLGEGAMAEYKNRDVGPQLQTKAFQHTARQLKLPEPVQGHQYGCSIRAAAAQAAAHGQFLLQVDIRAQAAAGACLQQTGRPEAQIPLHRDPGQRVQQPERAILRAQSGAHCRRNPETGTGFAAGGIHPGGGRPHAETGSALQVPGKAVREDSKCLPAIQYESEFKQASCLATIRPGRQLSP